VTGGDFKEQTAMDRNRHWTEALLPMVLLVSVGAVLFAVTFAKNMGVDEGVWNCIGRMWAHGQPVYQTTMDNKPPGIFTVYALTHMLTGPGFWLPRLLGVISMTAATGGVYLLGRNLHSRQAGMLAALMFGLSMGWSVMDGPFAAQTESFMVLPTVFAFLILFVRSSAVRNRGWILLAGVLLGVALSFKQTVLFSGLSWVVVYLALMRRDGQLKFPRVLGDLLFLAGGVLAGMAAFIVPVLACGAKFEDYWFGTWILPLLPGTGDSNIADRAARMFGTWCQTSLVLFYLPLAAFFWRARSLRAAGLPVTAMTVWMLLEFIGAGSSGFWYGHQIKQVMPAMALLGGIGLAAAIRRCVAGKMPASPAIPPPVFWATFAVVAMIYLPWATLRHAAIGPGVDLNRRVGLAVQEHSGENDYVLNLDKDSGVQILAWADRSSPSRWFYGFFLHLPKVQTELNRDLALHRPRLIVAPSWWHFDPVFTHPRKTVSWPPCMDPLRPGCKRLCTLHVEGESYDIYECASPHAPSTMPDR
jgi:hypothetical protein